MALLNHTTFKADWGLQTLCSMFGRLLVATAGCSAQGLCVLSLLDISIYTTVSLLHLLNASNLIIEAICRQGRIFLQHVLILAESVSQFISFFLFCKWTE